MALPSAFVNLSSSQNHERERHESVMRERYTEALYSFTRHRQAYFFFFFSISSSVSFYWNKQEATNSNDLLTFKLVMIFTRSNKISDRFGLTRLYSKNQMRRKTLKV